MENNPEIEKLACSGFTPTEAILSCLILNIDPDRMGKLLDVTIKLQQETLRSRELDEEGLKMIVQF
jgi:hypothetical protein